VIAIQSDQDRQFHMQEKTTIQETAANIDLCLKI